MTTLSIEGLTKVFGGLRAIDDLSFEIPEGRVHSVIGPNGAGKTTLFNLVTGVYQPSAGRVSMAGRDLTGLSVHERARLGMSRTFQNLQICMNMSALENVMLGRHKRLDARFLPAMVRLPRIVRADRDAEGRCSELMVEMGLERYIRAQATEMPYGALKRLEIARALASEPSLLLLDEPAAGLNATETAELDRVIHRIGESGVTVLLVEHDMKLVMNISRHIVVLNYGKKLAEGTAEEIRRNPDVIAAYLGAA